MFDVITKDDMSADLHKISVIPNEDGTGFFLENCQYLLSFPDMKFTPEKNGKIIYTEDNIPVRKIYFSLQSTKVSSMQIVDSFRNIFILSDHAKCVSPIMGTDRTS